jgi:hypothetical protein
MTNDISEENFGRLLVELLENNQILPHNIMLLNKTFREEKARILAKYNEKWVEEQAKSEISKDNFGKLLDGLEKTCKITRERSRELES